MSKKKDEAPAANPPNNDFQMHPGDPEAVGEIDAKEREALTKEIERRGTASKYAKQHAGQPGPEDPGDDVKPVYREV